MFSTYVGVIYTSASIILAANSAIFHLCCTFIQGQLVKSKKNTVYTIQRHLF